MLSSAARTCACMSFAVVFYNTDSGCEVWSSLRSSNTAQRSAPLSVARPWHPSFILPSLLPYIPSPTFPPLWGHTRLTLLTSSSACSPLVLVRLRVIYAPVSCSCAAMGFLQVVERALLIPANHRCRHRTPLSMVPHTLASRACNPFSPIPACKYATAWVPCSRFRSIAQLHLHALMFLYVHVMYHQTTWSRFCSTHHFHVNIQDSGNPPLRIVCTVCGKRGT